MLSSVQVFDLIKQKRNIVSDYELENLLGVSHGLICKHRKKPFGMDNALAMKCAELLHADPALLILWASAERAKCTEEAQVLRRVAAWVEMRKEEVSQGFQFPDPPRWNGQERRA